MTLKTGLKHYICFKMFNVRSDQISQENCHGLKLKKRIDRIVFNCKFYSESKHCSIGL